MKNKVSKHVLRSNTCFELSSLKNISVSVSIDVIFSENDIFYDCLFKNSIIKCDNKLLMITKF